MGKWNRLIQRATDSKEALKVACFQAVFWFAWAFGMYGTVYLQSLGWSATDIGNVSALNSVTAIFACICFGLLSDKWNSVKKVFGIVAICAALFYGLTPFLPTDMSLTYLMFFVYYPFINIFRGSVAVLFDNMMIRTCSAKTLNYGVVRALGSFTFAIASILAVVVIAQLGLVSSFVGYTVLLIPILFCWVFAHDPKVVHKKESSVKKKLCLKPLTKNYYYITFLVFGALLFLALSAEFSFLPYLMEEVGISGNTMGSALSVRAFAEIPLLIFILRLRRRMQLKILILAACLLMAVECFILSFASGYLTLMVAMVFFGFGNGLLIGTAAFYVMKLAPEHLKATAQTVYSAVCAVAGILGNVFGGMLYDAMGGRVFYQMLGGVVLLSAAFLACSLYVRRSLPNPADAKD